LTIVIEYFKSVFHRRRWTVMTLPPLLIACSNWLIDELKPLPNDLKAAHLWVAPWWEWCLTIIFCFAVAQLLAWHEEHKKVKTSEQSKIDLEKKYQFDIDGIKRDMENARLIAIAESERLKATIAKGEAERASLERELSLERGSLAGCPQIILQHEGPGGNFYVRNSSSVDGISVALDPVQSPTYLLKSDRLPHVSGGSSLTLKLLAEQVGGTVKDGPNAWSVFVEDRWAAAHPIDPRDSQLDILNRMADELTTQRLLISVKLTYKDLAGRDYDSPATIAWDPLSDAIEVRPGVIEKHIVLSR
jgi:hypothetical protein